ncbi:MAG: porphobilinogen synthase [Acidobacteriota bacterium]
MIDETTIKEPPRSAEGLDTAVAPPLLHRPRRTRRTAALRELVAETVVPASSLVQPHFVLPAERGREEIPSMPGIERLGVEGLLHRVEADLGLGLRSVLLFGIAAAGTKDHEGRAAADAGGAVQRAVSRLRAAFGKDLVVMTDVCLCAYTEHGHCGLLSADGEVDNDPSLARLAAAAVSHAGAGADIVAPSDMMDGRVAALRQALDVNGFESVGILSYAAKYASAYYGPFRDAAASAPGCGDRRGYQMDSRNVREALREVTLDLEEGADLVMVKPGLPYLDVVRRVADLSPVPVAAYNVSGEFSSVKAAAARGWLDEASVVRENLVALRRAGAEILVTYHGREALAGGWLERA